MLGGAVFHEDIVSCGAGGLIAVEDICFSSTSEADLLPFYGRCYVGYIPTGGNVIGLSKAARLAAHFGQRVQSQQTFTQRFLDGLDEHLRPQGAAICVVAQHLGEALHTRPPRRVTLAASGSFQDSSSLHLQVCPAGCAYRGLALQPPRGTCAVVMRRMSGWKVMAQAPLMCCERA